MTREQYIAWKASCGDDASHADCAAADHHIKVTTMANLKTIVRDLPKPQREYILLMARATFGSVETDEFLTAIKAYPDYI